MNCKVIEKKKKFITFNFIWYIDKNFENKTKTFVVVVSLFMR